MKILIMLAFFIGPLSFASAPGEPINIFTMRKEIQKTVQIIGNGGLNQDGKWCRLNTFMDRSKGDAVLGFTFRREDASTIYLFYPHQEFHMKKTKLPGGGTLTEFFMYGKLFLILESIPRVSESAHIEAANGHFQNCTRRFR
jgi:hypothetical protein